MCQLYIKHKMSIQRVCLISQTGTVLVDRQYLVQTSKVFRTMIDKSDEINQKWKLDDFSQRCLEQFADFIAQFHHVDCKLPDKIVSLVSLNEIQTPEHVFVRQKSHHEVMELLFLSNFIEYPTLFHVCCVQMAHWSSLHTVPVSDEFICRLRAK